VATTFDVFAFSFNPANDIEPNYQAFFSAKSLKESLWELVGKRAKNNSRCKLHSLRCLIRRKLFTSRETMAPAFSRTNFAIP